MKGFKGMGSILRALAALWTTFRNRPRQISLPVARERHFDACPVLSLEEYRNRVLRHRKG